MFEPWLPNMRLISAGARHVGCENGYREVADVRSAFALVAGVAPCFGSRRGLRERVKQATCSNFKAVRP